VIVSFSSDGTDVSDGVVPGPSTMRRASARSHVAHLPLHPARSRHPVPALADSVTWLLAAPPRRQPTR